MPTVSQTIKFRRQRHASELHKPWLKLGLVSGLLISMLLVIFTMAGIWYYLDLTRNLPSVDVLPSLLEPPNGTLLQPSRLYDRTHEHVILTLENPAASGRQYLFVGTNDKAGVNQASQYLVDATIAVFEPGFWKSPGYTLTGMSEGTHSTLAQLLISNLVLDDELPSLRRSIRERMLAAQVTAEFGRENILEWYLNSAQYGEYIYGADAAARAYFGMSATNLSLAEAAMLTAIGKTPSIKPMIGSQYLKDQQEQVIQAMYRYGFIRLDEAQKAFTEDLQFQTQIETHPLAPAFTDLVLMQLSSVLPLERISRGGYEIVTTLDYGLQQQAACASQIQLERIQGIQESSVTEDGTQCDAALLLPTLQTNGEKPLEELSANVVIVDPPSGQILSMVGEDSSEMVPAYPTVHPAGTILSPFLYLTAFTRGMSPATLLWDIPGTNGNTFSDFSQGDQAQGLSASYHGPVRLRMAFINDYAGAATEVLRQVGGDNVLLTQKRFGITTQGTESPSETTLYSLYSQQITLLESVQAYSVLANQGIMAGQPIVEGAEGNGSDGLSATSVLSVMGVNGQVRLDWTKPQVLPIANPQLTYLITEVLSDEKSRWSNLGHPNSLEIGRPAGAKVSLTNDTKDGWAVGYIPKLAIGVWIGDSHEQTGGISTEMPAGLWHAIMQYASSQMPVQEFEVPSGISRVQVCDPSGLLVSVLCPAIVQEIFLSGNEPTQIDNLYQKYFINHETGLLATIFTPSALLEEKVYLVVPPQAVAWAKEADLPIPPDTYDNIYSPPPASQDVLITNPLMFDQVGGLINIFGSAGGNGFSYYRLQVGQGLYPQQWIQIGEDVDRPVDDGLLGTWDTSGLEGLYVVQLMVVKQDQRVDRAILQVTIDNKGPQVQVLAPKAGEQFVYQQGENIIMQVSASDNLVLERVEFIVDDRLESTLIEPPFVILWPAQLGEHTLSIKAYDLAGNASEVTATFSVHK
jgi:membrane peptidoglycan carboxypeptidase